MPTASLTEYKLAKPASPELKKKAGLPVLPVVMALGVAALIPGRLDGLSSALGFVGSSVQALPGEVPAVSAARSGTASADESRRVAGYSAPAPAPAAAGAETTNSGPRDAVVRGPELVAATAIVPIPPRPAPMAELSPTVQVASLTQGRASPVGEERAVDGRLLAEIARRQADLDRRERDLETRAAQVAAAENLAKEQIAELTRLRTEIERFVVRETEAADADVDTMVRLYGNMRPQQAAKVLEKLDAQRAALILQRLGERLGGPIMAAMEPQAALAVTQDMVSRREAFRR